MRRCCRQSGTDQEAAVCLSLVLAMLTSVFVDVSSLYTGYYRACTNVLDLTKYDCSSADINPIGAVSKMDL